MALGAIPPALAVLRGFHNGHCLLPFIEKEAVSRWPRSVQRGLGSCLSLPQPCAHYGSIPLTHIMAFGGSVPTQVGGARGLWWRRGEWQRKPDSPGSAAPPSSETREIKGLEKPAMRKDKNAVGWGGAKWLPRDQAAGPGHWESALLLVGRWGALQGGGLWPEGKYTKLLTALKRLGSQATVGQCRALWGESWAEDHGGVPGAALQDRKRACENRGGMRALRPGVLQQDEKGGEPQGSFYKACWPLWPR